MAASHRKEKKCVLETTHIHPSSEYADGDVAEGERGEQDETVDKKRDGRREKKV